METAIKVLSLLPWTDWVAVAAYFGGWVGYVLFAKRRSANRPSVLASTNRIRRQWMLQATHREVRVPLCWGWWRDWMRATTSVFSSSTARSRLKSCNARKCCTSIGDASSPSAATSM